MASVDNFFAIVYFFGIAIFLVGMGLGWHYITTEASEIFTEGGATGLQIQNNADNAFDQIDWLIVMAWFALHVGILVTSYLLRANPVMLIVSLILMFVVTMVAAPLSNGWEEIQADENIGAFITSEYPWTNYIMANLPRLEIVWCLITIVVLYGLSKREGYI